MEPNQSNRVRAFGGISLLFGVIGILLALTPFFIFTFFLAFFGILFSVLQFIEYKSFKDGPAIWGSILSVIAVAIAIAIGRAWGTG